MWNSFVKNKQGPGGKIPLDLQLEFYNKLVKEAKEAWPKCIQEVVGQDLPFTWSHINTDEEF